MYAELGALVTGRTPGRTSVEEIIFFSFTGTALPDVAAACVPILRFAQRRDLHGRVACSVASYRPDATCNVRYP